MHILQWLSKSLSRQVSTLLVLILFITLLMCAFYFYHIQSNGLQQSTKQMARQLISSLNSSNAKHLHFDNYYAAWTDIKNQIKNNRQQMDNEGLFKIDEIALLDIKGNIFAHSSPADHSLQKKYTGELPDSDLSIAGTDGILFDWLQDNNSEAVRIYANVEFQGRSVGLLILQLDLSLLMEQQHKLIINFIEYLLMVLFVAIVIGLAFGRWISYPLSIIEASLAQMGSGKLQVPELHKRNDEYYKLALAIERIDQNLYESQSQVNLLLDSTAEAIYGIDPNGKCTFANQSCLDMLGYQDISELLGNNMHDLIHYRYSDGSHYPVEKCHIYQAFQEKHGTHVDDEVLWRKDGSSFTAEYWSHPIFKEEKCIGAVVTFLDITDRIEARKALQDREQNLSITLNSIGDAVIATDAEGYVTRMNPIAEQLTGWSFDEAQGQALKTIFPIINASTREPMETPVDKVIATGETIFLSNHTTLIAKDGTEYQIADSAAPIRDNDQILGMVLVFNDVTEQYQLREAAAKNKRDLQAIMDHSPAVIYVKDTEGRYTFINQQYEMLFHIKRKDIIGKTDHDIFPKDLADKFQHTDKTVLKTGHALESEEIAPQDDGPHTYVSIKFPLLNEKDEIYAICGISTDITEYKHQEQQLRRSQKMDALGKLTGGIAHDYNNLLGIIQGYAEQLNEHLSHDTKLAKYAQDIQHAAERGARLTKKLLVFSRHKNPDAKIIDINTQLQEQQLMLEKTLTARIKLVYDLADDLWPVELDSGNLEDAIINMSINAMHAMKSGGELTLRTSNEQLNTTDVQQLRLNAGDYVLLSIIDTGCGMDEATKEKIFDPFYTTKGEQGTGLGLSQVYGFVERSGGAIKVYSEPGHGTHFALYFPRSHQRVTKAQTPTIDTTPDLRGNETLLVVDDEQAMAELAHDILTAQGYRVLTANDGEQALLVLEKTVLEKTLSGKKGVDLIISDVIMPNMDGYQLAAQVQQRYPHIKLQMVSGFADDRHNNMTDNALHQNMLYKPYASKTLLSRVRSLLDEAHSNTNTKTTSNNKLAGRAILVMDDEEDVRELFQLNLEKLGCQTVPASNGDEAIALYQQSLQSGKPIDAVILDLTIPGGLGGKEVADKIRDMDPNAKMIVASGHSEGPEMTHYQDYGFQGALEKNFNRAKIKQVLEEVLASN